MKRELSAGTEEQQRTDADDSTSSSVEANPMLSAVYGRKITPLDLFMLDVKSNQFIKKYRDSLGLETQNNRVDTGDLKMIVLALYEMGFDVVERLSSNGG
jgi:hypothetical protein